MQPALATNPAARTSAQCRETVDVAAHALRWFMENPEQIREEGATLVRDFRKYQLVARKLDAAALRPMCVGVFGPSQAGKSYLISALARRGTAPAMTVFAGRELNFVAEINPEGGQEATGLVTRFTIKPVATPAEMPVALRLLSQTDIVKILGNTFLSDFDLSDEEPPSVERIKAALDELAARVQPGSVDSLTEDDVYDLQEYFDRYFKGQLHVKSLGTKYWNRAAELAPRLQGRDRAQLFSLIWGEVEPLTALYLQLLEAQRKIGFSDEAFCPLDSLVPRDDSIIDVRTLRDLGTVTGNTLPIVSSGGQRAVLERSEITALIAELTVVLKDKPWPFFDHTDLLDFPGARTREDIKDARAFLATPGALFRAFLRGKVAYLFQRYCAEQELTSMLLCIAGSNQEVQTLPTMVNDWISSTHGNDPAERAKQPTALFLVLTKFDMEFGETKGQAASSDSRWSTRLHASLLDFFGKSYSWPKEWTPSKAFDNSFWLRNPNAVAKHLLDYGGGGVETGIRASEAARVDRLRSEFIANADARSHFADPEKAWDEAMRLNDGGISHIANSLAPVCNPDIKRKQIDQRLASLRQQMASRLTRYYVSDDLEAELAKRRAQARRVGRQLAACASNQRFGHLLRDLQATYPLVADVYYRIEMGPSRPANGGASAATPTPIGTRAAKADLVKAIFGDEQDDEPAPPAESGETHPAVALPSDTAELFAIEVTAEWIKHLRRLSENPDAQAFFELTREQFGAFANELVIAATRFDLTGRIAERVRLITSFRQKSGEAAAKPIMQVQRILNGYIDWLGFDALPFDKRPRAADGQAPVFVSRPMAGDLPELAEVPSAYEKRLYIDWITAFLQLTEDNVRFRDSGAVDIAANAKLGEIVRSLGAAA